MNQRNLDIGDSPPADSALPQQATILKPPSDAAQAITLVSNASGAAPAASGTTTLAGFELLGELGRGGMGVVYKARQISLNRLVALKMILAGAHAGAQDLARFRNEAEAVARLQHPNIVQIHEVGEAEGRPFFALELVEGGSLADMLNGTPQPALESAQLVETLARAIHAAHQQGIVHRDLKPANILLQIADCGLRIDEEKDTSSSQSAICNLQSPRLPISAWRSGWTLPPAKRKPAA
jgi:serine/threonine protein kinase